MTGRPPQASLQANLANYFNGTGFDRWSAIYSNAPVSRIRQTVREGHLTMLATAEAWLRDSVQPGDSLFDAGCGTGLFSTRMAAHGLNVTGIDIAPRMITVAQDAVERSGVAGNARFTAGTIESASSTFDAVACLDVLVHYPAADFTALVAHLAQRTNRTLLITYAPYSRLFATMYWAARFFPQGQRRTDLQMTPDTFVKSALCEAGMAVQRSVPISRGFYHVTLLEAHVI